MFVTYVLLTMSSFFSKAMMTYNKNNYSKDCLTDIILAAENGFEPALYLLLSEIFLDCRCDPQDKLYSEKELYQMIDEVNNGNGGTGILHYILSNKENACNGAAQNLFRKSMEKGFILGKVQFARLMFQTSCFAIALKHYLELFDHPHYKFLSEIIRSHIFNDISLCYYRQTDYESFWKYNKQSRKLTLGVAFNNAANAYMRGEGKPTNVTKALNLYKEALKNNYSANGYVEKQIATCSSWLNKCNVSVF
jgi:hypothetical protein